MVATSCPFGVVDRRLPPDLAASAIAGTGQSTAAPPAGNQTSGLQGSAGGRDTEGEQKRPSQSSPRCQARGSRTAVDDLLHGNCRALGSPIESADWLSVE